MREVGGWVALPLWLCELILLSLCRAEVMDHSEITSTDQLFSLLMPVINRNILNTLYFTDTVGVFFCIMPVWLLSSLRYPPVHKSQTVLICSHLLQWIPSGFWAQASCTPHFVFCLLNSFNLSSEGKLLRA